MSRLFCFLLFPFLLSLSCVSSPKRQSDPYGGLAVPIKKMSDKNKDTKKEFQ